MLYLHCDYTIVFCISLLHFPLRFLLAILLPSLPYSFLVTAVLLVTPATAVHPVTPVTVTAPLLVTPETVVIEKAAVAPLEVAITVQGHLVLLRLARVAQAILPHSFHHLL